MTTADALEVQAPAILSKWEARVRAALPQARLESGPTLIDHLPAFLTSLARALKGDLSAGAAGSGIAREHAAQRAARTDYAIDDLVQEYAELRHAILEALYPTGTLGLAALQIILEAVDRAVTESTREFSARQRSRLREVEHRYGEQAEREATKRETLQAELHNYSDALRRETDRKHDFIAMLAHELRNPLSAIRSSIELLRLRGSPDEATQRPRAVIERQVRHLTHQVDDLLDVARLGRGTLRLRKRRADLGELVRHAVETVQNHVAQRRQQLRVALAAHPVWIDADPTRVSQVVFNLLHNASKFSEPGCVIEVEVRAEGPEAVVVVRDQGAGIDADLLPHVFDLYAEGVRWVNGTQSGLGLGLKLARCLVELHGGQVGATSAGAGQGSEFSIRLPRRSRKHERGVVPAPADAEPPATPHLRVMVVDDNVDAASALAEVLAIWGHHVVEVHDGQQALVEAVREAPDVVFLDLSMPGMDGHEVARRLQQHPGRSRMKVVALTGYGQESDRLQTAREGFDDHLVKPVDLAGVERLLVGAAQVARGAPLPGAAPSAAPVRASSS